ncbi:MAG: IS66 family transposase [Burkholderiaceae bacterium]
MREQIDSLQSQLDWFKRQLFGHKSEKRPALEHDQAALFERTAADAKLGEQTVTVPEHKRRKHRSGDEVNEAGLRFTEDVPVRTIRLSCPELDGPDADQYEIIDYKESLRLARQPGSHVVLRYERPVIRAKADGTITTVAAPLGVLDHAQVDVSMLAGLLIDKFQWHLPLYRQHQRLAAEGITLAPATIEAWVKRTVELLGPVAAAIKAAIVSGDYLKVDETPIKAGRMKSSSGQGKMKTGWLWPILGEHGDIAFTYSEERGAKVVRELLGEQFKGTIQTDGYEIYARYAAKQPECTHALCWAHTRRTFIKAEAGEPQVVGQALEMIRALYKIEKELRDHGADSETILATRTELSEPIVDKFFGWVNEQIADPGLLPKSPLARALNYAREREAGLRVFLKDAWVALDTNDLERALRVVPMGRKNWMFCTSELGARHVAIVQTIIATCRAHGIDTYTYLVDVLLRINQHPANKIDELTPRQWQQRFAADPLRSDLVTTGQ